jgi:uncharacterized integral membrane protein
MRKAVTILILFPIAAAIVLLAVANRRIVTVSLDPLSAVPEFAITGPLFLVLLLTLLVGVVIGGVAAWLRQSRWRRAARRAEAEVRRLRSESEGLRKQLHDRESFAAASRPHPASRYLPAA